MMHQQNDPNDLRFPMHTNIKLHPQLSTAATTSLYPLSQYNTTSLTDHDHQDGRCYESNATVTMGVHI